MQEEKTIEITLKFKLTIIGNDRFFTLDPALHDQICRWALEHPNEEATANFFVKSFLLEYAARQSVK